jgi:ADP-ribose pyrophosphatase YjhB (NUDIX family)
MTGESGRESMVEGTGPAVDPEAPYARLAVVGVIARRKSGSESQEWLLLRRSGPVELWDPPGGRVERGEDLRTAVLREMEEETGLSVQLAGPCYAYLTFHKGERLVAVSMACRAIGDTEAIRLEPENAVDWRWAGTAEWEGLAAGGRTSWASLDVARVTRLASTIWEASEE